MSDEHIPSDNVEAEEEFEEITSDEVDRVVAALESLSETVTSENIKAFLDEASTSIYELIYDDEDEAEEEAELEADSDVDAEDEYDVEDDIEDDIDGEITSEAA